VVGSLLYGWVGHVRPKKCGSRKFDLVFVLGGDVK
jgi:hypothetical protein